MRQRLASAGLESCTSFDSQKDRTKAHGSKVSTEECFTKSANVRVDLVACKHDRNAAEAQNQRGKSQKSPWSDIRSNVASAECFPRHDCTEIYEHGRVEQQVSNIWETSVLDLIAEPAIPSKTVTSTKGYKEVVRAKDATYSDTENCEEQIEHDHAGRVNVASAVREAQKSVEDCADDEACSNTESALPEDSDEEVFLDSGFRISMNQCVQSNVEESAEDSQLRFAVTIMLDLRE